MSRIVPAAWMPRCRMKRIILHWTAGGYKSSGEDRVHYHLLIEGDGHLVRGEHTIADNVRTSDDNYAAHVARLNAGSIGVTACCMFGAMETPFHPGRYPLNAQQVEVMATVAADLCEQYEIPVTPETVLGHGEVQSVLGVPQRGKWDPMVLPFDLSRARHDVGDRFRQKVSERLGTRPTAPDPLLSPLTVLLDGRELTDEAIIDRGASWCPVRPLSDALGWTILAIDSAAARLQTSKGAATVRATIRGDRGFVQLRDLCVKLGLPAPAFDAATRTVMLRSH
jgi:hypothetical protein